MLKISRPNKENKSKIISLRLKPNQMKDVLKLKGDLKFETVTDLMCYSLDIFKRLHEWKLLNYHFYIANPENKNYKEVELEL
ncbi:MAG: hypothetical protein PHF86_05140 [Candidatus Nanoarchaeia archaeon]|jgi:hypothetical protein|nr:hypothetical protein [Candidatus Nanoarchaeia archaeon]